MQRSLRAITATVVLGSLLWTAHAVAGGGHGVEGHRVEDAAAVVTTNAASPAGGVDPATGGSPTPMGGSPAPAPPPETAAPTATTSGAPVTTTPRLVTPTTRRVAPPTPTGSSAPHPTTTKPATQPHGGGDAGTNTVPAGPATQVLPGAAAPHGPATGVLLGVYYGNDGATMDDVRALEAWQGKGNAVVNLFTGWIPSDMSRLFDERLPNIWANHNVPMISWEPFINGKTTDDIELRIVRGEFDGFLNSWVSAMKGFLAGPDGVYGTGDDRRAYIRFAHEMNGNWYPWSPAKGGGTGADYVAMWRHVHDAFTAQGIDSTRLGWVWSPNRADYGGVTAEQVFPGDDYVDWLGLDGYNRAPDEQPQGWRSVATTFDPMLARLRAMSQRPVAIVESATTSFGKTGSDVAAKDRWLSDFFAYAITRDIRMVVYFNKDAKSDWTFFGGASGNTTFTYGGLTYQAYDAYRTAVARPEFVASDPANPRLLDDHQFSGGSIRR